MKIYPNAKLVGQVCDAATRAAWPRIESRIAEAGEAADREAISVEEVVAEIPAALWAALGPDRERDGNLTEITNAGGWQLWPSENDPPLAGAANACRRMSERNSNWPCAYLVPLDAAAVDALERWARQYGARYAKANTREATAAAIEAALRSVASVAVAGNRAARFDTEPLDPDEFGIEARLDILDDEIDEIGYDIEDGERALAALRADLAEWRAERARLAEDAAGHE